jgi:hypothetical protein
MVNVDANQRGVGTSPTGLNVASQVLVANARLIANLVG